MATVTQARITADQFLKMDLGDGLHELVKGEVVQMPPPDYPHGYVCGNGRDLLQGFGRRTGHGHAASNDSAVRINDETVRGADVSYYSEARWPRSLIGRQPPSGPPDVVIEVRSPSDRWGDVLAKVADNLRAGVPLVMVLEPRPQSLTIFRDDAEPVTLGAEAHLENLPELPGFRRAVADFLA